MSILGLYADLTVNFFFICMTQFLFQIQWHKWTTSLNYPHDLSILMAFSLRANCQPAGASLVTVRPWINTTVPTSIPNLSLFQGTDFCSTAGFDTLHKRVKEGRQVCKDLEEFLKQRLVNCSIFNVADRRLSVMFIARIYRGWIHKMASFFNNIFLLVNWDKFWLFFVRPDMQYCWQQSKFTYKKALFEKWESPHDIIQCFVFGSWQTRGIEMQELFCLWMGKKWANTSHLLHLWIWVKLKILNM
jgi:hypothetical protein